MERNTRRKIKVIYSDNGKEYTSDPLLQLCREGIERHFTVRKTLQQNGVDEKIKKILLEKVRCMLSNARLSKSFWAEALAYAFHLINMLSSSVIEGKTPLKVWSGKVSSDYDLLRLFGYPAITISKKTSWIRERGKVCSLVSRKV